MAAQELTAEEESAVAVAAAPALHAPRPLSWQARLLLACYRLVIKPSMADAIDLAKARELAAKMDRWLGGRGTGGIGKRVDACGVAADWIDGGQADKRNSLGRTTPARVILYLHGGGFMFSTPRLHARLAARLCRALNARALMPEYRLAPEHPLPAAFEDCLQAYRWLLDQGHAAANIVIVGDSAGGTLALATLQRIRDAGLPLPACAAMFSPGTCFDAIRSLNAQSVADDPMIGAGVLDLLQRVVVATVAPNDAAVSPCAGSLHGLSPLLFQAGSTEVLLAHAEMATNRARSAGTHAELQVWPRMPHVWQAVHWLPEAQHALECVRDFVMRHSGTHR